MHIGLFIDEERLQHEHAVLNRLALGLVDEGAKITRFIPENPRVEEFERHEQQVSLIAPRLEVPLKVPPWMRSDRARQMKAALDKSLPEVLYAIGESIWPVALEFGSALDRPVAINVWTAALARGLKRRVADRAAAFVAPTEPLAELLRQRVDPALVTVIPPGVAAPNQPRHILAEIERAISIVIVGGGRDVPAYSAMLAALSRLVREFPQIQAVIELRGPRAHHIWREARRLDLLSHLSAVTDAAPLRSLLTRCDVLIIPERFGEMRSLILEAMGRGMAIVGAHDPALDMLTDDRTAALVDEDDPEAWSRRLRNVLNDPEYARRLGHGARELVLARHGTPDHVQRLLDTLGRAVSGDAYSFAEAREGPRP